MLADGPIDVHSHFLPPQWNAWRDELGDDAWPYLDYDGEGVATLVTGGRRTLRIQPSATDPGKRLAAMEKQGLAVQVLSPVTSLFGYELDAGRAQIFARRQNEWIAEQVAQHPDRFVGFGAVPLQDPQLAVAEAIDAHDRLGLGGIEIGTYAGGRDLDHEDLEPFFRTCAERGIPIFVHPTDEKAGGERLVRYYLPNVVGNPIETALAASKFILGGLMERYPDLRICFSHCGGSLCSVIGRVSHCWDMREDTRERSTVRPAESAKKLFVDSITHDPDLLRYVVETMGWGNVVLGTDFPFVALGDPDPLGSLQRAGLSDADRKAIATTNGKRFLGVSMIDATLRLR